MTESPPPEPLIPHDAEMRLIDRVLSEIGETVRAEATVRADNVFFHAGRGLPAYVGFELMAQTISAYDGLRRRRKGFSPAVGFLLGCRKYEAIRPYFREGERLLIQVTSLLGDEGMSSFDCRIEDGDGAELATGVINVYRPKSEGSPQPPGLERHG
jgi:predicted hotdog family 3-hydroxylacyl-ACP dehydratase